MSIKTILGHVGGGVELQPPIALDRPHQTVLDLFGFEICSATRYFDDTVLLVHSGGCVKCQQPDIAQHCILTLGDSAAAWVVDLRSFIHRNDPR